MFYFAYGSNMNHNQMKERCPGFKFIKRVYAEGYRFVYDGYSSYRQGAVANIVKDDGGIVWGALYEITPTDLKNLDRYEGYPECYQSKTIIVKDDEKKEYEALTYLREPKSEGQPSDMYRKIVYEGAKQCNLPEEYIKQFILK